MTLRLYMDHHVPGTITAGLRLRGVDVITAHEDGRHRMGDPALLDRASHLGRTFVSFDEDLLVEAARRQRNCETSGEVIYALYLPL